MSAIDITLGGAMKRILLDTNLYTAFKRNDAQTVNLLKRVEYIGVNIIILGELYAGFRCGSKERQNPAIPADTVTILNAKGFQKRLRNNPLTNG